MATSIDSNRTHQRTPSERVSSFGKQVLRYGLVLILLTIGGYKFTAYEAKNIEPLVANSPLTAWAYGLLGLQKMSALIGSVEIAIGLLIALRLVWPIAAAVGSFAAVGMFVVTLSFLFSTPGVWEPGYGFPFLSGNPGQFLCKDILFLGAAMWSAGEAWRAYSKH